MGLICCTYSDFTRGAQKAAVEVAANLVDLDQLNEGLIAADFAD